MASASSVKEKDQMADKVNQGRSTWGQQTAVRFSPESAWPSSNQDKGGVRATVCAFIFLLSPLFLSSVYTLSTLLLFSSLSYYHHTFISYHCHYCHCYCCLFLFSCYCYINIIIKVNIILLVLVTNYFHCRRHTKEFIVIMRKQLGKSRCHTDGPNRSGIARMRCLQERRRQLTGQRRPDPK